MTTTEALHNEIIELQGQCNALVNILNDRLSVIHNNTNYLNDRIGVMEDKLDRLTKRVDVKIDVMCDNTEYFTNENHILEDKIITMEKRMAEMESQHHKDIEEIRESVHNTNRNMGHIRSRVTGSRCY